MTARAMWKAEIALGDVSVPVKMYAAVRDAKVHFRLLHAADLAPVQQAMVDPGDGEIVPPEEIHRALEVDKGVFVELTDEELEAIEPEPSRQIRVEQVLDASAVDLHWFDRPYYLGPDGDLGGYEALAEALEEGGRVGIARWVMRKKRYHGALHARDGHLVLTTLRRAEEIVEVGGVRPPADRAPDKRELALAEQLVATLEDEFDPHAYRDEYRDRVMELIESKQAGRPVELPARPARRAQPSLRQALEASLHGGAGGG